MDVHLKVYKPRISRAQRRFSRGRIYERRPVMLRAHPGEKQRSSTRLGLRRNAVPQSTPASSIVQCFIEPSLFNDIEVVFMRNSLTEPKLVESFGEKIYARSVAFLTHRAQISIETVEQSDFVLPDSSHNQVSV